MVLFSSGWWISQPSSPTKFILHTRRGKTDISSPYGEPGKASLKNPFEILCKAYVTLAGDQYTKAARQIFKTYCRQEVVSLISNHDHSAQMHLQKLNRMNYQTFSKQ